jgi:hypothetical protein
MKSLHVEVHVEAIPDARYGEDEHGMLRDRLNFLAQMCHIDMKAVGSCLLFGAPQVPQQHLPSQNLATMGQQDFEQIINDLEDNHHIPKRRRKPSHR